MEAGQRQDLHTDEEPLGRPCPSPTDIANAYEVVRGAERVWREESRIRELRRLLRSTANLNLTRELLLLVLEELAIDDDFDELVGDPATIPPSRFPQAIAMAIAFRHSWRRDDLETVGEALEASLNPTAPVEPVRAVRVEKQTPKPTALPVARRRGRVPSGQ